MSAVTDSAWVNDTPCTDWNVKDVVNHIVDENIWMVALFNGRTIAEIDNEFEGNLVGDDPASAIYVRNKGRACPMRSPEAYLSSNRWQ